MERRAETQKSILAHTRANFLAPESATTASQPARQTTNSFVTTSWMIIAKLYRWKGCILRDRHTNDNDDNDQKREEKKIELNSLTGALTKIHSFSTGLHVTDGRLGD